MKPGFDKNGLYITEYAQQGLTYLAFAIPSEDLAWSDSAKISLKNRHRFENLGLDVMPAVDWNPSKQPAEPAYFVTRTGPTQNGFNAPFQIVVHSLTWSGSTRICRGPSSCLRRSYSTPVEEAQPGTPNIRGLESHRTCSVQQVGSHLHVLEATGPSARSGDRHNLFFWFDVSIPEMKMFQSAKIYSTSLGFLFPSLAVDSNQNVLMAARSFILTARFGLLVLPLGKGQTRHGERASFSYSGDRRLRSVQQQESSGMGAHTPRS